MKHFANREWYQRNYVPMFQGLPLTGDMDTTYLVDDDAEIPYLTLHQHEIDSMSDDVPAMSEEGL